MDLISSVKLTARNAGEEVKSGKFCPFLAMMERFVGLRARDRTIVLPEIIIVLKMRPD